MEYLPLTGSQKWLMSEMLSYQRPGWVTIEFFVRTKVPMDVAALESAIRYLVNKYESLRVKITGREGVWIQQVYPSSAARPFAGYDLSPYDRLSQKEKVMQACIAERNRLLPGKGDLIRVLFFKFSENEGRIWFCMHHVISDLVTGLILSREFMAAYSNIVQGKEVKWLVMKEYRKWIYILEGYCRDILIPAELDYWLSLPWERSKILPSDFPDRFYNEEVTADAIRHKRLIGSYTTCHHSLEEEETLSLFNRSGAEAENTLIAVFFLAIADLMHMDWLDIYVMNAGRNILPADYEVNMNKVVGYLSTVRSLLLERPVGENIYLNIRHVVEQIRNIPNAGLGLNLIVQYITDDQLRDTLLNVRKEPVVFNYLGRIDLNVADDQYEIADEDTGLDLYEKEIHNTLLECIVGIRQNRLFFKINYSADYFLHSTMEALVQTMVSMLRENVPGKIMDKAESI